VRATLRSSTTPREVADDGIDQHIDVVDGKVEDGEAVLQQVLADAIPSLVPTLAFGDPGERVIQPRELQAADSSTSPSLDLEPIGMVTAKSGG
jgi:hypothetical protein